MIQINDRDNVAIVTHAVPAGTWLAEDLTAITDIPQGHKILLKDLSAGAAVIRYGTVIGYADRDLKRGSWIHEEVMRMPTPPSLDNMPYGCRINDHLPVAEQRAFQGYANPAGGFAGTRNILGIQTTVQCVQGVLDNAVEQIQKDLLPRFPHVDGVVAVNHAYGCGVAIDAPEAIIPIRALRNMCCHPNFGGQLMVVSLGCEKLTVDKLIGHERNTPENVIVLQDQKGYTKMIDAILEMAEKKLQVLEQRRREVLPLSKLLIGMQCGGSDGFSGITANPAAGYASDLLVEAGATVMFGEVTEVRDGAYLLAERCISEEVRDKLAEQMRWNDRYLQNGGVDRSANTTPGNKQGGLSNIVEKALGSIAKSGTSPIVEVLGPAELPSRHGLIYTSTPASDIVCGPSQLASGMGLQVFMTGRGTPYGLAAAPVIKVSSRSELKRQWPDLIDVDAGPIAEGHATVEQIGKLLFDEIIQVASGLKKSCAEELKLYNYQCIFNPAPIT